MRTRDPDLHIARREAILKSASGCFIDRGFHATSMKEVCAAAGMSPGTLYHYFRSKTEIIIGIIEEEQRITAALLAGVADAPDVLVALVEAFERFAASVTERDLILHAEVAAEVLRQQDLRHAAIAADRQVVDQLATAIRRGQDMGQFDTLIDATQSAKTILALMDGILSQAALEGVGVLAERMPLLRRAVTRLLAEPDEQA